MAWPGRCGEAHYRQRPSRSDRLSPGPGRTFRRRAKARQLHPPLGSMSSEFWRSKPPCSICRRPRRRPGRSPPTQHPRSAAVPADRHELHLKRLVGRLRGGSTNSAASFPQRGALQHPPQPRGSPQVEGVQGLRRLHRHGMGRSPKALIARGPPQQVCGSTQIAYQGTPIRP